MRLGLGLGMLAPIVVSGASAPTLSSLDFDLADTLGGGSITATGTDLSGASVTVGGTSATVTGSTSTTVTFTMPAKSAGSHNVVATTGAGSSNALTIEAWAPTTDSSCKYLVEKPDYASDTWTARLGSNMSASSAGHPPASSGEPSFDGSGYLTSASNIGAYCGSSGSIAAVVLSTNTETLLTGSNAPSNPLFAANHNTYTHGVGFGKQGGSTSGFAAHGYDTSPAYSGELFVAASANDPHAVIFRWDMSVIELNVDGGTFASQSFAGAETTYFAVPIGCGEQYGGTAQAFRGKLRALVVMDAKASSTFNTKFYKWSKQRHGVA